MEAQEIFDKVARHLLTQNKQSRNKELECLYRGEDGAMCAAGCLIPEDLYDVDMEGHSWKTTVDKFPEVNVGHIELVQDLQNLHDNGNVEGWPQRLKTIAVWHKLSDQVLQEFAV